MTKGGPGRPPLAGVPARTAGAVPGYAIVAANDGTAQILSADRNGRGRIARRGDSRVADHAGLRVPPVVPSRGHDDNPRADGVLNGPNERVSIGALENGMPEREIDDLDIELAALGDGELDRRDHVARLAGAVGVEHLEPDEMRRRRHTLILSRIGAGGGDQPGDVRAVTVVVVRHGRDAAAREIVERVDAFGELQRGTDAGIDDRDAHATALRRSRRQAEGTTDQAARAVAIPGRRRNLRRPG